MRKHKGLKVAVISWICAKAQATKAKTGKQDYIKLLLIKGQNQYSERQPMEWGKYLQTMYLVNELILGVKYPEYINTPTTQQKINNPIKKWAKVEQMFLQRRYTNSQQIVLGKDFRLFPPV